MGDGHSTELDTLNHIDRFGAQAVMGRPLYAQEIHFMIVAENIANAYRSREVYRDSKGDPNWVEWTQKYEALANILIDAEKAVNVE
jgi:hemoglobin-like flavoprotein